MTDGPRLRLLNVTVRLTGDRHSVTRVVDGLGSFAERAMSAEIPNTPEHELRVEPATTVAEALAALTMIAVGNSPLLCIHAGVVSAMHGTLVIPGNSGLGKTTLVAALVRAGFGYLSDEVLAFGRGELTPADFGRPLGLAADSWRLLGLDPCQTPGPGQERLAEIEMLGEVGHSAPVTEILLAERRPGAASIEQLSPGTAVQPLLGRSFNHFRDPAASFHAVVKLARNARIWRAGYQDAPELATLLASRWLAH